MRKFIIFILVFILFIAVWQIIETQIDIQRVREGSTGLAAFIPTPSTILFTFINDGKQILRETTFTLSRAGIGFLWGMIFAFMMAALFYIYSPIRYLLMPFAYGVNSFPIIGFAPVIILAFGQGSWLSIIFIAALISYFPILIYLDSSFQNTDKELGEYLHVMNINPTQKMIKVVFPLALPSFFTAMRLAIPASIIGATMGEWLGTRNGIGQLITISLYQLKPGMLYAALFSVTAISLILIGLVIVIEYYIMPWRKISKY